MKFHQIEYSIRKVRAVQRQFQLDFCRNSSNHFSFIQFKLNPKWFIYILGATMTRHYLMRLQTITYFCCYYGCQCIISKGERKTTINYITLYRVLYNSKTHSSDLFSICGFIGDKHQTYDSRSYYTQCHDQCYELLHLDFIWFQFFYKMRIDLFYCR